MSKVGLLSVSLLYASSLLASQPDAKSLLRDAAGRYRNAQSFRIEFETTITSSTPFSHGWSKQIYVVAADGKKYHWESEGTGMRRIRISDGQSDWFYSPGAHEYSVQSADPAKSQSLARGTAHGTTEGWIRAAIGSLLHLDSDSEAAELRHDQTVKIGNHKVSCYVIHRSESMAFREGTATTRDYNFWIEKSSGLVRKAVISSSGPVSAEDDENEKTRTVETIYTTVELSVPPDASLFEFKPPADAFLIDDARRPISAPPAEGSPAPDLKLTGPNGEGFDLNEMKGRVVLVDFWASWCGACVVEMKAIAQLPQSYSKDGLTVISVDEDETPKRGDELFASQQFQWTNFHDVGATHRRSWGVNAFPMLFLIDREGKIAWSHPGISENFSEALRSQLDKPELKLRHE